MRILVDVMGGDHAPLEMVKGACLAAGDYNAELCLIGDKAQISEIGETEHLDLSHFTIVDTPDVMTMTDDPMSVTRGKKNSSMAVGLKMLADGQGDAFVSTGNTGALFLGGSLLVRKLKGVQRAAIATILPFDNPVLLLDSGANVVVTPDYLEQFAVLGSIYMKNIYGLKEPRVGLLNNGAEECKGTPVQTETYQRLKNHRDICFVGNVEANHVMSGECDVLVTDGFSGNIFLKSVEGTGKYIMTQVKQIFLSGLLTKMASVLVKKPLTDMKKKLDPREAGGAPLLGLKKPVIKAHGSSDAVAFKNAIGQAIRYVDSGLIQEIALEMQELETKQQAQAVPDTPEKSTAPQS